MSRLRWNRRQVLKLLTGAGIGLSGIPLLGVQKAWGDTPRSVRRLVIFYFPDGVPGVSADGEPSLWHPTGSGRSFVLPSVLAPLERWREQCLFYNGLSMGPTDSGSHPGGAKKLLTGVDGGNGESVDQFLARTVAAAPFRHVYLGVQANQNNASGDKHISYVAPGTTVRPEDDPVRAFNRLFVESGAGGTPVEGEGALNDSAGRRRAILDYVREDLNEVRGSLGGAERSRLDTHLESIRELEIRLTSTDETPDSAGACSPTSLELAEFEASRIHDPSLFPRQMRDQVDVLVTAMACGLTRVGVVQASQHTSELIMSRFVDTDLYDPGFDMRSHQASHYGPRHDEARREFSEYVAQRRWFVEQYAYLLSALASRPEGDGTMLDHTLVWLCTEVSDGNTHLHDNMPFVLSGGGAAGVDVGQLVEAGGRRHGDLLTSIVRAMGSDAGSFGAGTSGVLPGFL
jgi:hypothetical protein